MNKVALVTVIIMIILNSIGLAGTVKTRDTGSIVTESVMLAVTLLFAFLCFFKKSCAALGWFFLIMGILRILFSSFLLIGVNSPGFSGSTKYDTPTEVKRTLEIIAAVNMVVAVFMVYLGTRKTLE